MAAIATKTKTKAMRVKMIFKGEEGSAKQQHTIKFKIPKKWHTLKMEKLLETFMESYNTKHGGGLKKGGVHLVHSGKALSGEEVIRETLSSHDELRVEIGSPPAHKEQKQTHWSHPSVAKATESTTTKGFNYSKWDNLDVSDEEEDAAECHPNIDKKSWIRLRRQQREERRREERENIERLKDKVEQIKSRIEAGAEDTDLKFELEDARHELEEAMRKKKWTADELCEVTEDVTLSNPNKDTPIPAGMDSFVNPAQSTPVAPVPPPELGYEEYIAAHKGIVVGFATMNSMSGQTMDKTRDLLLEHPELLSEHAVGYMLLMCLDFEMSGQTARAKRTAQQYQIIQSILELAKGSKKDPRSAIHPFFRRIDENREAFQKGFEKSVDDFYLKLQNRAKDKIAQGEKSPLQMERDASNSQGQEQEQEQAEQEEEVVYGIDPDAPLGPGGLSPSEVFDELPPEIQNCFISRDIPMLERELSKLPREEAETLLDRCVKSGLWQPGPSTTEDS
eukprot:g3332.t1